MLVKFQRQLHHRPHAKSDFDGDHLRALMQFHHLLLYQKPRLWQLIFQQHQVLRKLEFLPLQHHKDLLQQQVCPLHAQQVNLLVQVRQQFHLVPTL